MARNSANDSAHSRAQHEFAVRGPGQVFKLVAASGVGRKSKGDFSVTVARLVEVLGKLDGAAVVFVGETDERVPLTEIVLRDDDDGPEITLS